MVEVDKDVPMPIRVKYPYEVMELGDSFMVVGRTLQYVCNSNYRFGKRLGRKFIARSDDGGIRVWRVL